MPEAISKFEPHRTLSLKGFDRRGCAAAINNASSAGISVSGVFSDLADFAVLMLFDADDNYGHLTTTRYLPDFDLTGVVLEFDLAITNGMYPGSTKYPSVPWGSLSYIESSGTRNTTPLDITSTTGEVAASCTFTLAGTPTTYDRVQIVYLGNVVFDMDTITTGQSLATVAANLAALINAATSSSVPLTATSSGATVTITATVPGQDGNTIELVSMYKTAGNTSISPAGAVKLTGGVDPTSFHVKIDFSALGLTSLRQCWFTLAPSLPIDSGGVNPTLVPFAAKEFSYVFSNWTVTDPGSHAPLKIAGPGSVVVGSQDSWSSFAGSGWSNVSGFYYRGFARKSSNTGDSVTIQYSCQSTHDLYLGTLLAYGNGTFDVTLDGVAQAARSTALEGALSSDSPVTSRRLLASGVAAGSHTVVLTVSTAPCTFDYLHAAVPSDVQDPTVTYSDVNAAWDFDTNQTYQIPPARALWVSQKMGFAGDLDFYAGVFFALKRKRAGGSFHQATVTIAGYGSGAGIGTGFGDGDVIWVTVGGNVPSGGTVISGATSTGGNPTGGGGIGGTVFGVAVYPADTLSTLAQRIVNAINALFVGIAAAPAGTAGQLTITVLSPINGFALDVSLSSGAAGTITVTGDIGTTGLVGGQEGTWGVDETQTSPLNRAFTDYLADLAALIHTAGQTMTVAFSQELLAPPDANTSAGAWSQRFSDGTSVLTDTAFGSWGAGYVESVSSGTYQQTNHGYITGNTAHFASSTASGVWEIVVTDADHYTLGARVADNGSGYLYPSYTPAAGDSVFIDLQTSQCNFNPSTVTPYLQNCYIQAAAILAAASLTPWLQFGEVGWWFFSRVQSLAVGYASWTSPISIGTNSDHNLVTGEGVLTCGIEGNTAANAETTCTVVDPTHVTLDGTAGNGTYTGGGTISGGGMAYYDAYTSAAASTALGRALASFWTQDDDPSGHAADVSFLAGQIYTHISTIISAVLAVQASAKFELLYPLDVNFPSVYFTNDLPYPQGGRLNAAVNLPSEFLTKAGSGLDRLKMEGLSWESQYFHHDNFVYTARFPYAVLSWPIADVALLIAWDTGSCPWTRAYLFFANEGIPLVNLWAVDHAQLFSWPVPLPENAPRVAM